MAELVWSVPGASPGVLGVVPLLLDARPAVALPWSLHTQARAAAAADGVALVLAEPRMSGPGWAPTVLHGRLRLVEDGDGSRFREDLLAQEVRKHPPSRALLDSPLLRREHWWYLPRLILLLDVTATAALPRREGPDEVVLAVDPSDGLAVAGVRVGDWDATELALTGAPGTSGPAVLVGQELSVPDVERWTVHTTSGRHHDGRFTVERPAARRALEPTPGLLTRVRRQRALQRGCVAALRAAGHA